MPLLLSHASARFCSLAGTPHASDSRHSKGDVKGSALSVPRGKAAAAALFGSPNGTPSTVFAGRLTAVPSHQDAADTTGLSTTAAAGGTAHAPAPAQDASSDAEWEAVRLMTAARILSASSDDDTATNSMDIDAISSSLDSLSDMSDLSLSDLSAVSLSPSVPSAQQFTKQDLPSIGDNVFSSQLGAMSYLDEIRSLDADSLALAVGILRQHQPVDAGEDDVQLSERLRDFLMVLRRRPGHGSEHNAAAATAGANSGADDVFVGGADDEWADVRAALMGIGIDASLDEEDDEDVWALEAGRVKTRRTRLLRSLPKLDSSTAQQLTAFLAEAQRHSSSGPGAPPSSHHSTGSTPGAAAATAAGSAAEGVGEEEEQWWQQASLAYSLLRQQAGKVQEQGAEQQ